MGTNLNDTGICMSEIARTLIVVGVVLIIVGLAFQVFGKIPWLGKLPGDIFIKKENMSFYFPLTTSILISVILSLLFYLWNHR